MRACHRCFTRAQFWVRDTPPSVPTYTLDAMVDFTTALQATAAFGNFYSTLSSELVYRMRASGRLGHFYNPRVDTGE